MASSKESFIGSNIPYPELFEPGIIDQELTNSILRTRGGTSIPTPEGTKEHVNITALDLHRTDFLDEKAVFAALGTHLDPGVNIENLVEGSPEAEKIYAELNEALLHACDYITNVLTLKCPKVTIRKKQDVLDLIQKTSKYNAGSKNSLEMHAGYCALVLTTLAVFELQRKESHLLQQQIKYVERLLTEPPKKTAEDRIGNPLIGVSYGGGIGDGSVISMVGTPYRMRFWMRGKNPDSSITKYARKEEASAEEALKDAIGMRGEIPHEAAFEMIKRFLSYAYRHMGLRGTVIIENKAFYSHEEDFAALIEELQTDPDVNLEFKVESDPNPVSSSKQRLAIQIRGKIPIPQYGIEGGIMRERDFEFMFVDQRSKGESGLANHDVYDLSKLITVMTRFFGGCSKSWITRHAEHIERAGGPSVENILKGLLEDGRMIHLPGKREKYGASSVYIRWYQTPGFLPAEIRKHLEHVLPEGKLKAPPEEEEESSD